MGERHLEKISSAVKETRNRYGLSQTDVSKMAGVSRKFISDLENGKQTLEIAKVFAVTDSLGINLLVDDEKGLFGKLALTVKVFHAKGQKRFQ